MIDWRCGITGGIVNSIDYFKKSVGFIYVIETSEGRKYIGKKNLYSERKKPFTLRQLDNIKDKRKKTYEMVIKESNWKTYNGSNAQLTADLKSGRVTITKRVIIRTADTSKELTYYELEEMILSKVLQKGGEYYNDNILGKFFRKDLVKKDQ